MEVLVPYPGRRPLSQLRLLSATSFPSVGIIPPNGGAALLRRQPHGSVGQKLPYRPPRGVTSPACLAPQDRQRSSSRLHALPHRPTRSALGAACQVPAFRSGEEVGEVSASVIAAFRWEASVHKGLLYPVLAVSHTPSVPERRQPRAPTEPYGIKAGSTKNTPVTSSTAATM